MSGSAGFGRRNKQLGWKQLVFPNAVLLTCLSSAAFFSARSRRASFSLRNLSNFSSDSCSCCSLRSSSPRRCCRLSIFSWNSCGHASGASGVRGAIASQSDRQPQPVASTSGQPALPSKQVAAKWPVWWSIWLEHVASRSRGSRVALFPRDSLIGSARGGWPVRVHCGSRWRGSG